MKCNYFLLNALLLITLLFTKTIQAQNKTFSQQQIIDDFHNLYSSLVDTHYNAFAYISEKDFEARYQKLKNEISSPNYNLLEAITLYQQLVSSLNNGHTEIDFPVASYIQYAHAGGTLFPLELALEGSKAFIRANYSHNASFKKGAELISINDKPITEILEKIYPQISAERQYLKNAKLEIYTFPRYYWYVYGQQDKFEIKVRFKDKISNHHVTAIDVFNGFEDKKDEIINAQMTLRFYEHAAYLNPGNFSGDEKQYQQFIDDSFKQITTQKTKNLIIDLRNNGGGNDSFSDYLVSYIADKPFKWSSKFSLRTSQLLKLDTKEKRDLNNPYWRSIMEKEDGTQYEYNLGYHEPVADGKRYKGNVYVLVNRHSHSQSSVTAAQIQDYGWGKVVGEETAEYPSLYASQFQYSLPITGIIVKISKGYIVRVNGSEEAKGVVPTMLIKDKLRDDNDEILTTLLTRLSK